MDNAAWTEANGDLGAAIKPVRDMVSSLHLNVDTRQREVDEVLTTIRHDITVLETNLEESNAKIASDTDQAAYADQLCQDIVHALFAELRTQISGQEQFHQSLNEQLLGVNRKHDERDPTIERRGV